MTEQENRYIVKLRRQISTIMKITKKARAPDVIKIEYGSRDQTDTHITDTDKFRIPKKAGKLSSYLYYLPAVVMKSNGWL